LFGDGKTIKKYWGGELLINRSKGLALLDNIAICGRVVGEFLKGFNRYRA